MVGTTSCPINVLTMMTQVEDEAGNPEGVLAAVIEIKKSLE